MHSQQSYAGLRWRHALLCISLWLCHTASAMNMFMSNSLNTCMKGSSFTASLFKVVYTANNNTLTFNVNGFSQETSNVVLDVEVLGYGYTVVHPIIDPCKEKELAGMCPMNAAPIEIKGNLLVPADAVKRIPTPIYYIPDLDLKVRVWINSTDTGKPIACVEADLGNGKTVHQKGMAWSIALIVLLSMILSAVISELGYSNSAAHLASNALSLFSYFQSQALLGMTAVSTPPIVRAWTQNFQWSMGIIRVQFLQEMATWYQRATGGKPSTFLSSLATTSVQVQKRSLEARDDTNKHVQEMVVVRGIERVGFLANIEATNIFFTSYIFFVILIMITTLSVVFFKYGVELLIRWKKVRSDAFSNFRRGWKVILKGILFRLVLITFPQVVVMCFWELTRRDSPGEATLAGATALVVLIAIGTASFKVWKTARRSVQMYQNPAYILYSDLKCLHKWGSLYIHFKATMYFFVFPLLLYSFLRCLFVALSQQNGEIQAIALLVLELAVLVAISTMRPYMDKKTNGFNIAIASVNLTNVFLLVFFSGVFGVPALAIGIMGVLFFLLNAIFAAVIIGLVLWTSIAAILSKNPENRYQPMQDDRDSFVKSRNDLNTELDALGATARGEMTRRMPIDDDEQEYSKSREQFAPSAGRGSPLPRSSGYELNGPYGKLAPGVGPQSPARAVSPLPRSDSPAYWRRGVGY